MSEEELQKTLLQRTETMEIPRGKNRQFVIANHMVTMGTFIWSIPESEEEARVQQAVIAKWGYTDLATCRNDFCALAKKLQGQLDDKDWNVFFDRYKF